MTAISITEFKQNIAQLIDRAAKGEVIEVTQNNRTIVELRPRRGASDAEWNAANKRMIDTMRRGFVLEAGTITEDDKYGDVAL
ncbi:type II toxin-antitoxin system prevent-host-death family antitoxin [Sphingomonas sp. S1-29]|uniref:type II toxin-antitoxin system Phd/YefM family antitoxin n=1 Tax=Sphingomonas sp. S1-29 TaxID=2991074 RepID=UPI002240A747|nr:type II toxin-antitoxin system prevent-host-death family antitoxin [Sphingomonas sp. S1-29]UZK69220.1 type II toxin-antitoxin system prevent-host-death family antitoxin [Sphingomonas sp. S1-29]